MRNTLKALKFTSIVLFIIVAFIACDKDFSTVQSDVLGEENSNFFTDKALIPVLAYNKKLDSLQINNLSSNLLGVYNDPAFGQTVASFVSQLTPTTFNPNFGEKPTIDSVVLNIPYFSKQKGVENGNTTYSINDSLYGTDPIELSIYQNGYFLKDYNASSLTTRQNYYSKAEDATNNTDHFAVTEDATINFDDFKGVKIYEDLNFFPSDKAIVLSTGTGENKTSTRSVPAFRVKLDTVFWHNTILKKEGQPELSNANNFKNYLRGLYFKAKAINGKGHMILMNIAASTASVTIYYSKGTSESRTNSTYTLNFSGNRLNTFINNFNLPEGDKNLGDEKLNLKGLEGSMAVVELFSGTVDCDDDPNTPEIPALDCFLDTYRKRGADGEFIEVNGNKVLKQLINDAQLIVYEDTPSLASPKDDYHEYDRIYAYDLKNNTPTVDYLIDPTGSTGVPVKSKILSLGVRSTDENNVSKYKIRLTEHLNNILIRDSTNTKIGLVLSSNVNVTTNSEILNSEDIVTSVPSASILMPRGTKLYGTKVGTLDENKKMRLEIFFTKPKN